MILAGFSLKVLIHDPEKCCEKRSLAHTNHGINYELELTFAKWLFHSLVSGVWCFSDRTHRLKCKLVVHVEMYDFIPFVSNGWMLHDNYKQSIGSFLGLSTASEKSAAGP